MDIEQHALRLFDYQSQPTEGGSLRSPAGRRIDGSSLLNHYAAAPIPQQQSTPVDIPFQPTTAENALIINWLDECAKERITVLRKIKTKVAMIDKYAARVEEASLAPDLAIVKLQAYQFPKSMPLQATVDIKSLEDFKLQECLLDIQRGRLEALQTDLQEYASANGDDVFQQSAYAKLEAAVPRIKTYIPYCADLFEARLPELIASKEAPRPTASVPVNVSLSDSTSLDQSSITGTDIKDLLLGIAAAVTKLTSSMADDRRRRPDRRPPSPANNSSRQSDHSTTPSQRNRQSNRHGAGADTSRGHHRSTRPNDASTSHRTPSGSTSQRQPRQQTAPTRSSPTRSRDSNRIPSSDEEEWSTAQSNRARRTQHR
jgi:hypothetical protein